MLSEAGLPASSAPAANLGNKDLPVTIHGLPFYVITGGPGSGKTTVIAERRQSRQEGERTEHHIVTTYTELGYRILRLPRTTPAERADFIVRHSATH